MLIGDPAQEFATQALLCIDPAQIIVWFVQRWQLESTSHEVWEHLGVEMQRQWNDLAIARTTPLLLGLFSIVTLLAQRLAPFCTSFWPMDREKLHQALFEHMTDLLCYAG